MKMNQLLKLILLTLTLTSVGLARRSPHGQACVPPPSDLVAWWPGDGNTLDYQGDSNGTLQNGATFAPGKVAEAFAFNGVNQFVQTSNASNLNFDRTNSFSMDAWIRTSETTHNGFIASKQQNSFPFRGYVLIVDNGEGPACVVSNPPAPGAGQLAAALEGAVSNACPADHAIAIHGTTHLNDGQWHHVAMTYDGSSSAAGLKLYVDGALETTLVEQDNLGTASILNSVPFTIGSRENGGVPFNGDIDEVEVFNRALSAAEIQAIFNAGSAGQCKPPLVIQPTSLPDGAVGLAYSQTITAGAGTGPYTFTVSNGSLPTGLSLSSGGVISGTPQTTGSFNFTVQARDANNTTAQRAYSMSIVPGCIAPPSNLVGWYPGDGNAVDIQTGNNGSLQGGATFAPGKVAQAFSFNGTSAYVQAPAVSAQDPTTAGSMDAWVFFNQVPSAAGHPMEIIAKGGNGTDFEIGTDTDNKFKFYIAAGTNVVSTTVAQAGVWYHVAATWDSTVGLKIYVNGQLENTNSAHVTRGQSNIPLQIGNHPVFGPRLFNGLIDEAQLFSRALTPSEVQDIFNAGIAGQCKSPSPNFCGVISGQITDAQGPLQGALVQACEPNDGPCSFNATTDATGNYQITGLPLNTPFDLTVFPPQGSVAVPGELLDRSVQSCNSALTNQDLMLQAPAPPPSGTSIEPHNNGGGGVPTVYWQSPLTLTTTGCPNGTASYIISRGFSIFASGPMTETPAGSGTFTASVPALFPAHGAATVSMTIDCGGGTTTIGFDLYIDPSGTVRDSHGTPISGATVTLLRSDTAGGPFTVVPDGSAVMSPGNRHNPDMTDADGHFGWDVLSGFYKVRAENAGCNGIVETDVLQIPPPVTDLVLTLTCPTQLTSAVSRKTHGAAGDFTVSLPLTGNPGIECRSGGADGSHTLVFNFLNNIVSGNATVTNGIGSVSGNPTFAGSNMTVNLTGVANVQTVTLTLSNVTDDFGQVVPDTSISAGFLLGDTTGNGIVNSSDVSETKLQSGQALSSSNFREDVTVSGSINASDVSTVKSKSGTSLP